MINPAGRCVAAIGIALSAALLAGCAKSAGTAGGPGGRVNAWTKPHELVISDAADLNTLNPHLGTIIVIGDLSDLTMAWLLRWDEHNNPVPELATAVPTKQNGGVSADGLTITYHLRKGVKWSDGAPFDADDVVFSTKVVLDPATNETSRLGWDRIASVEAPDKYTVVFHLKKPYSPFVETFFSTAGANPCILPKHLLAKYPNINNVPYNSLPVGIGPFKYERWVRSEEVVMVANPLYWRGRPKLDRIVYKIVPDRNTLLSQLEAHDVDLWWRLPASYAQRVSALAPFEILRQPGYTFNHVDFNVTHPVVSDRAVREALRLALDRNEIREKINHGIGTVQDVTTPGSAPYYDGDLGVTAFDVAKANALLDGAGWKLGPDGVRVKNGRRLSLDFATISGEQDVDDQIELMRANWKKIGVELSVRHYSPALMFVPEQEGGIAYGDKWDVVMFAWTNDAIGDYSSEYSCRAFPPVGQNNLRWCNPKAQAAMDALYGHYDQAQRNADVKIVERELVGDVPTIVTIVRDDIFVYNRDLRNFHPNAISPFDNMMDVDI